MSMIQQLYLNGMDCYIPQSLVAASHHHHHHPQRRRRPRPHPHHRRYHCHRQ